MGIFLHLLSESLWFFYEKKKNFCCIVFEKKMIEDIN